MQPPKRLGRLRRCLLDKHYSLRTIEAASYGEASWMNRLSRERSIVPCLLRS